MNYAIYKLKFNTGVHFGKSRLYEGNNSFMADTLFSALCQEALKLYGEKGIEDFVSYVQNDKLRFSDAFPYIEDTLFLPKPILEIQKDSSDSSVKKQVKKLTYISVEHFDRFVQGDLDIAAEVSLLNQFGITDVQTRVNKRDDTGPYQVGVFHYAKNTGLYFIVGYEQEEILDYVENLLISLGYEGIGGKTSSGLGKFEPRYEEIPEILLSKLNNKEQSHYQMLLSVALPKDEELSSALESSYYAIIKRSGFIRSETYAEGFRKKKDLYCMRSGSCIINSFCGDVYDVSNGGKHPVYRYAVPLFMGVNV